MVLVPARWQHGVDGGQTETFRQTLEHIPGHLLVIDESDGKSVLAALDALGDFLQHTASYVLFQFHLCILRHLERPGFEMIVFRTGKHAGQGTAYHIVQEHDIVIYRSVLLLRVGQLYEAAELPHGHLHDGIVLAGLLFVFLPLLQAYGQIDGVIGRC